MVSACLDLLARALGVYSVPNGRGDGAQRSMRGEEVACRNIGGVKIEDCIGDVGFV